MKARHVWLILAAGAVVLVWAGCSTPSMHVHRLTLTMTPEEVVHVMGRPFTIRAAKTYEGGDTAEVWEYYPPVFSLALVMDRYDKSYWLFFENGRLVQWGEPGDFSGTETVADRDAVAVKDYSAKKLGR